MLGGVPTVLRREVTAQALDYASWVADLDSKREGMTNPGKKDVALREEAKRWEYLQSVRVGPPQVHNAQIELVPYNPDWPRTFEQRAEQIRAALGDMVLLLEHVGSTSISGLPAKPIIDIVLAVADSADEAAYVPPLGAAGYVLRIREPDWFEHRLLKSPQNDVNLHVFSQGCEEIRRMVAFRDWLRSHEEDRLLYQQTKQRLANQTWKYVQDYADAKSEVVAEIMSRALARRSDEHG